VRPFRSGGGRVSADGGAAVAQENAKYLMLAGLLFNTGVVLSAITGAAGNPSFAAKACLWAGVAVSAKVRLQPARVPPPPVWGRLCPPAPGGSRAARAQWGAGVAKLGSLEKKLNFKGAAKKK